MRKRLLVPEPFWLAKLQARLPAVAAEAAAHHRPGAAARERQCGERGGAKRARRTLEGLGIEPVAVAAVVPAYLEQFRPRGQFSIYRPQP